jgi:Flp pilus assembly secretin CpaC
MLRGTLSFTLALLAGPGLLMANKPIDPSQPTNGATATILPAPKQCFNADQITGMREAVAILERSNRSEAATLLRHKITELELNRVTHLLEQKERELTALQTELATLRGSDASPQVSIAFQVWEVSLPKLQDLDARADELSRLLDKTAADPSDTSGRPGTNHQTIDNPEKAAQFLEKLKQRGIAKLLAEPTIITSSNRPLHFHSGGEIAVPVPQGHNVSVETKKIGTTINANPALQSDGSLKLDFRIEVTNVVPSLSRRHAGQLIPGYRKIQAATTTTLRSGQALVLNGLKQLRTEFHEKDGRVEEHDGEFELLILVMPTYPTASK